MASLVALQMDVFSYSDIGHSFWFIHA